jgi:uncharacterized membrane protein (DUF106 family)
VSEEEGNEKSPKHIVKIVKNTLTLADSVQTIKTVTGSLAEGYAQLSGTFTVDQKRVADSVNFASNLETLKSIAESDKRLVELAEKQIEDAKKQRKLLHITTAITIIAIIVAIIAWVFPRKA